LFNKKGMSLGHTALIPENQEYSQTKSQILASLDVTMGGRVAEELSISFFFHFIFKLCISYKKNK
jgi:ATP-dependent Zn protease